ncbi:MULTISPECIES: META domain-containing protein [unclassified Roseovarius]|uniref:META domain-containing protein n=1 Tax=unclassified Roseovarius TaxID=2614913 RepID=UPI0035325314
MMRLVLTLPLVVSLLDCSGDETLSGHGATGRTWQLTEIDGTAFDARATITFPEEGKIVGEAPCNRYFAAQLQPYPWFEAAEIGTTRRACPEMAQETAFLDALGAMSLAEVTDTTLILSTQEGREMVFRAAE